MENTTVGFLGAGKMAEALCAGFLAAGVINAKNVIASHVNPSKVCPLEKMGVTVVLDNKEVVKKCDVLFIAVKPHIVFTVLLEVSSLITRHKHLVISIAAGLQIATLEKMMPGGTRVIRLTPNTPSLVRCGCTVFCRGTNATEDDVKTVRTLCETVGHCEDPLPEYLINSANALMGSGPAFLYVVAEALADGGVKMGVPRDLAQRLAAQAMMGAGKMVLESGQHPGQLKDAVCSPGGTTIAGIHALERCGLRNSLITAVEDAKNRADEIGKM